MSTVKTTVDNGLATLRLDRAHGNAINGDLLTDLSRAIAGAQEDDGVRGVMLAGAGKLFCPGLDLQEMLTLDRPTLAGFLDLFADCILGLYAYTKPMLAAMHGHAVAGGCVLSLTADWRILGESAMTGLAELRVGVPFPFGVAMILRESVPKRYLEEVVVFGRNYRGEDAVRAGLAHETLPAEGFEAGCRARLEELCDKDPQAFAITKRYLRAATIERIREAGSSYHDDFLDCWFSAGTQARVRAVVAELQQRG